MMLKIGLIVLAALFFFGCATAPITPVVSLLRFPPGAMPRQSGYGFFVGTKGCVLTTYHQHEAAQKGETKIYYPGYGNFLVEFVHGIPQWDIALYRAKQFNGIAPIVLSKDLYMPKTDEQLFVIGPRGLSKMGRVANEAFDIYRVDKSWLREYRYQILVGYKLWGVNIERGESGSLVINLRGEAVAIIAGIGVQPGTKKRFAAAIPISRSLLDPILQEARC